MVDEAAGERVARRVSDATEQGSVDGVQAARRSRGLRNLFPVGLAFLAAAIDAISYLGLGRVFPANMTGNTVLLGIGVFGAEGGAALRAVVALCGFLVGAVVAAVVARGPGWSGAAVAVLGGELVVLAALLGWWLVIGEPTSNERFGLIAAAGVAMGAQSAVARRLRLGVTTTYITGTLTTMALGLPDRLLRRGRRAMDGRGTALAAVVVGAYLAGAATGAAAFLIWGAAAVVVPLTVLAAIIVSSAVALRRGEHA